jgi:hypothetical protein
MEGGPGQRRLLLLGDPLLRREVLATLSDSPNRLARGARTGERGSPGSSKLYVVQDWLRARASSAKSPAPTQIAHECLLLASSNRVRMSAPAPLVGSFSLTSWITVGENGVGRLVKTRKRSCRRRCRHRRKR